MTKLVSLDTSTTKTGWGLFIDGQYKLSGLLDCTASKKEERLHDMAALIFMELDTWMPEIVVVESVHVSRNMQTTRMLCEVIGIVRAWTIINGAAFYELSPSEWRKLVGIQTAGRKRDEYKQLSVEFVKENVTDKDISNDEADAICVGLGYIKMFSE